LSHHVKSLVTDVKPVITGKQRTDVEQTVTSKKNRNESFWHLAGVTKQTR